MENYKKNEATWDTLTDQQKAAFGEQFITHESNLRAWCKDFAKLSPLKKERVQRFLPENATTALNNIIGFGIQ